MFCANVVYICSRSLSPLPFNLSNEEFEFIFQAPQGVHVVCKTFPRIKIVTSEIEVGLNEDYRVVPGMGEFGDRYFGTDDEDVDSLLPSKS